MMMMIYSDPHIAATVSTPGQLVSAFNKELEDKDGNGHTRFLSN